MTGNGARMPGYVHAAWIPHVPSSAEEDPYALKKAKPFLRLG